LHPQIFGHGAPRRQPTPADLPADLPDEEVKALALDDAGVKKFVDGKTIRKVVYVKNKLVNVVVG